MEASSAGPKVTGISSRLLYIGFPPLWAGDAAFALSFAFIIVNTTGMVKAVKMLRASIGCGEILFEGHS